MNLEEATHAKPFVLVARKDNLGRVVRAFCPGHNAKMYSVDVNRSEEGWITDCKECVHFDPEQDKLIEKFQDCTGAQFNVCYHALAVLLASVDKQGTVTFYDDKVDAEERLAIQDVDGGKVFRLHSLYAPKKAVWVLFIPNKRKGK